MASNSVVRQFVIDVLSLLGIGWGAGGAAAAPVIEHIRQDAMMGDQIVAISAAQAAEGVVKNAQPALDWAGEAAKSGISRERFAALVALTGNPPGPETLLAMRSRHLISDEDVVRGLRQGYLKDEWATAYQELRVLPLSAQEAIEAAVQGHLNDARAREMWAFNSRDPNDYDVAFDTAGNPPGPLELLQMWNRGFIPESGELSVDQGLRESRLKDKWIPALKQLHRRQVPFRSVVQLLNAGAVTDAEATQMLRELGYDEATAAIIIKGHKSPSHTAHKQLSGAEIRQAYLARAMSRQKAVEALGLAGYEPGVANELLDLTDTLAVAKTRQAAIGVVRSHYVAHRIDRLTASGKLDTLLVPHDQRDELLTLWDLERETNVPRLTEAELRAGVKAGVIDGAEYVRRLVADGWTEADADFLRQAHGL